MITKAEQAEVATLCKKLIQIESYSGNEQAIGDYLREVFTACGYDDIKVDDYGNVIGHIAGKQPGKTLLFDGHIDTVPVVDQAKWTVDPFGGIEKDGKIYGRGASDMKGAVSAMVLGVAYFANGCQRNFAGDIYVSAVVHEECFEGVAARSISALVQPDFVVIGEASELNIKHGQRGRAEIIIETEGKSAHSANPETGINAVYKMAEVIRRVRELPISEQPYLGKGILELTDIKSSPYPGASVVPDLCRVTYDRRLLVGENKAEVLAPIKTILSEMALEDSSFQAKAFYSTGKEPCYTGTLIQGERFFPGWFYEADHPFVKSVCNALAEAALPAQLTQYSFCTNGSHYAGEAGIPTIGYGPSRENLAHIVDEYIETEQLFKATAGYGAIANAVLGKR